MANLKEAIDSKKLASMRSLPELKKLYAEISDPYNKLLSGDLLRCVKCGQIKKENAFYKDTNYACERYPVCKQCIMNEVEQRKSPKDEPNETKESVQRVLKKMNRVYDDAFYEDCVKGVKDNATEKARSSPFSTYIVAISALPQWKGKTWDDSDFGSNNESFYESQMKVSAKKLESAKRRFGINHTDADLIYLEKEYQDWESRVQIDTKSQETYLKQICLQSLDIEKSRREGKDVSKKLDTLDKLMNSANLQPRQNVTNAASDSLTFGQLIEKWENEEPIPEPDPEFQDVDGIGKYIRVWFTGWLSKALGLKTEITETEEFKKEIEKYTVKTLEEREEETSDEIYNVLFGTSGT